MAAPVKILSRKSIFKYQILQSVAFNTKKFNSTSSTIFSGIQPTGTPHIGNYLGAIKQWVELQNESSQVIYSIVDLHSITVPQNPQNLRKNVYNMVACLLACGIDPKKSILFQQSSVPEHSELCWILGCLTTMPRLEHLPQWKDKSEKMKEVPLGLFTYPVLQSADILLYKANIVPVGDDQVKHIELTRHLAKLFNGKYCTVFPLPKPLVGDFLRVKSLRSPLEKMSKSEKDNKSRIELTDSPDSIVQKVKKAVTDHQGFISYDPINRPAVSNLIDIHAAVTGLTQEEICENSIAMDKVAYKSQLADVLIEYFSPIRNNILRLQEDEGYLNSVLQEGSEQAKSLAQDTMAQVREAVGLHGLYLSQSANSIKRQL